MDDFPHVLDSFYFHTLKHIKTSIRSILNLRVMRVLIYHVWANGPSHFFTQHDSNNTNVLKVSIFGDNLLDNVSISES